MPAILVFLHPGMRKAKELPTVIKLMIKHIFAAVFAAISIFARRKMMAPNITPTTKYKNLVVSFVFLRNKVNLFWPFMELVETEDFAKL